jgi:hypothetical protein
MRIKTYNCFTVLLANNNSKVFKKAEYVIVVAKYELLGLFIGVCSVVFAVACVVCLLECCCLAVLHKLYCAELSITNKVGNLDTCIINIVTIDYSTS